MGNDTGQVGAHAEATNDAGNGQHDGMSMQQAREYIELLAVTPERADEVAGACDGLDGRLVAIKALSMDAVHDGCGLFDLAVRVTNLEELAGPDVAGRVAEILDVLKRNLNLMEATLGKVAALEAALAEEVVTSRLRIVDAEGRNRITAEVLASGTAQLRVGDENAVVLVADPVDSFQEPIQAGLFLSRAGFVVGDFMTKDARWNLPADEAAAEVRLYSRDGGPVVADPSLR